MTAFPIASFRAFETVRDADVATFGALPMPSMIDRSIIMLNDHRSGDMLPGPSSSGKTLPSFHLFAGTAMPLAAAPYRASGLVQ